MKNAIHPVTNKWPSVGHQTRLGIAAMTLMALAACGGGGGGGGGDIPLPPATALSVASYEGNYSVAVGEINARFAVSTAGMVTCTGSGLVVCNGQVTDAGAFTISGNDGLSPIDTTATLTGIINSSGNIAGSFTSNSVSGGPASGVLTGRSSTSPATSPVASYQGSYSVSGGGVNASLSVNPTGRVTCIGSGLVVCSGQVTADGAFTISGNDGLSPIDTTATLTGRIDSTGNIAGRFTTNSVSDGPASGVLTGQPKTLPTTSPTTSSVASYQGNYSVSGGGINASLSVNPSGMVTCTNSGLVVCSGQVTAVGAFTISGNDGLSPIDITATLTGSIDSSGNIAGSFTANSVSDGPTSGMLTGRRIVITTPGVRSLTRISIIPDSTGIQGTPVSARMPTSETGCVSAIGTYSDGSTDDITASVVWSSSQPLHATMPIEASGSCALITGYLVDPGVEQTPKYPLGIAAGQSNITARDPGTGLEGNLLLTVERGLNEGNDDFPLKLGGTVSLLRPAIAARNSYTSGLLGSRYEVLVKPLGLYAVRISGHTVPLYLHAGADPAFLLDCFDSDSVRIGQIGCTGRADDQGRLPILVSSVTTLSSPETFKMDVWEISEESLVNVGSAAARVSLAPDSDPSTNDLVKFVGVGRHGCSYYSVPWQKAPYSLSFRNMSSEADITISTPDNLSFWKNDTADSNFDFTFVIDVPDKPHLKTINIKYCSTSVVGTYHGSSARFTTP